MYPGSIPGEASKKFPRSKFTVEQNAAMPQLSTARTCLGRTGVLISPIDQICKRHYLLVG